jgi:predicted nucleic acid-binding protein
MVKPPLENQVSISSLDFVDKMAKPFSILEPALTAKADILVSSDIHLLELNPYRTIGIVGLQELKRWV